MTNSDDAVTAMRLVVFAVDGHRFALQLGCVAEAVDVDARAAAGDTWRHAGRELRAISAAEALGLGEAGGSGRRGLVLDAAVGEVLLLVEQVLEVAGIEAGALVETPPYFDGLTTATVAGLIPDGDGMIVLLRPEVFGGEAIPDQRSA